MPWIQSSRHLEEEIELLQMVFSFKTTTAMVSGLIRPPHRLVSTLFYCPATGDDADLGTSLYVPTDEAGIDLRFPRNILTVDCFRRSYSTLYTQLLVWICR